MKKSSNIGIILALLSAFFSAFNVIIEKKYINRLSSEKILFLMYLGAGIGLYTIHKISKKKNKNNSNRITKREIPKIVIIVLCELASSFLLMEAIKNIEASLVSLLTIFEIVATSLCAYFMLDDKVEKNEVIAIIFVLLGGFILNFKDGVFNNINYYSILVILACLCWGIENNLTALLSSKEPALFTSIKCGSVAILYLVLVILKGDFTINTPVLILYGFITYGLSILFYAISTKYIGASKATLVFSFTPIFGVILSIIFYKEHITTSFIISTILMIIGIIFMNIKIDKKNNKL